MFGTDPAGAPALMGHERGWGSSGVVLTLSAVQRALSQPEGQCAGVGVSWAGAGAGLDVPVGPSSRYSGTLTLI